jgi:hypothetical protein
MSIDLEVVKESVAGASEKRPAYFDDENVDRVLGVVMSLAGEVAVTGERLDTLERVLADKGLVLADELASYQPSTEVVNQRLQWHQAFIERLLRVLAQEFESGKPR